APLAGPGGLALRDDAALIPCKAGQQFVVTVDAIVAGVHYLPDDPPDLVARKLLRVNLSDLAAMGARPRHYLLTTALPAAIGDDWVEKFAGGLAEDQRLYGIDLLGGDSVATDGPAVLSLTAIGEVAIGGATARLRRSRSAGAPRDRRRRLRVAVYRSAQRGRPNPPPVARAWPADNRDRQCREGRWCPPRQCRRERGFAGRNRLPALLNA